MKKITILGHCNVGLSIILDMLYEKYNNKINIEIVSNIKAENNKERDLPYIYKKDFIEEVFYNKWNFENDTDLYIAANGRDTRIKIFDFFRKHFNIEKVSYNNLFHSKTIISKSIELGNGNLIGPGVTIAPFTKLGSLININRNSSIGHHTQIGDFVNINPGVTICGKIKIENNVTIGAGATIIDNVEIGENTIIGSGALVTKSIPPNVMAYGSPAKVIKHL